VQGIQHAVKCGLKEARVTELGHALSLIRSLANGITKAAYYKLRKGEQAQAEIKDKSGIAIALAEALDEHFVAEDVVVTTADLRDTVEECIGELLVPYEKLRILMKASREPELTYFSQWDRQREVWMHATSIEAAGTMIERSIEQYKAEQSVRFVEAMESL
jgi:hypothetical protein